MPCIHVTCHTKGKTGQTTERINMLCFLPRDPGRHGSWWDGSLIYTPSEERLWVPFLPQDSESTKLRCLVRREGKYCPLVAIMLLEISWLRSKRGGCFFPSLKANCFNKQSGRMSPLEGCYWCSSAIICWLLSNYLNSGNEAHPSVISPVTSPWCTKGASCETVLIVNRREIVLCNNERIAVHFRLEAINGADCCAVWSHLAELLEKKLVRKLPRRAVQSHQIRFLS